MPLAVVQLSALMLLRWPHHSWSGLEDSGEAGKGEELGGRGLGVSPGDGKSPAGVGAWLGVGLRGFLKGILRQTHDEA